MPQVLAEILGPDLLVIVAIIAVLFGGSQIPKLARSLGSAKREFEQGMSEGDGKETTSDGVVTMTRRDLDALLDEREAAARDEADPPAR